ncbi:MAG: DNA internalization-related competence protein ComEC/Rec2, partial [Gammaproteobacteria bacterium]|nr:DNA internalization-related competence protein ComEC/Rec2 [Gammaproteobacteria bacterium]
MNLPHHLKVFLTLPLVGVALPLLAGMVLLFIQSDLPSPYWGALLLPLAVSMRHAPTLRLLFWLLAGFLWAAFQADLRLSVTLPERVEGEDIVLTGEVVGLPEHRENGSSRLLFQIDSARHKGHYFHFPARVRLNWYQHHRTIRSGEQWQFTARLKRPHGFSNPGGFDWEQWLFQHNIRATGYVRNGGDNQRLSERVVRGSALRESLSEWIREGGSEASLGGEERDARGLLAALAVGDRQGISAPRWEVLRQTGTSHLMAISGLHVGLVATLLFLLFRWGWALSPRLMLYLPAQQVGALGALSGAISYAALAGFSIPTQRALVMVVVVMGMILLRRAVTRWSGYLTALTLLLLYDPFALLSAGFWLSFAAVGWILYTLPKREDHKLRIKWVTLIQLQGVLLIGLMPILLYLFRQGSLIAPVANLIAVPWVSMTVVPATLLGVLLELLSLPGGELLIQTGAWLMEWLLPLLDGLAALRFSHFGFHQPTLWVTLVALAGTLYLLSPHAGKRRWLGVLALIPLYFTPPQRPPEGEAWVNVLDVGQGLSVVMESHDKVLLYDTGDRFSSTFNAGSAVVVPFLHARGWRQVDLLVVGHGDRDHIGGLSAIESQLTVDQAISSVPHRVRGADYCVAGMRWHWSGVDIEVLHPLTAEQFEGNNSSCVVRISAGGESILLSGDIEKAGEQAMLRNAAESLDLQVDGVVVPHHGSSTSSSPEW